MRVVRRMLGLKQGDQSALSAALEIGVGVKHENGEPWFVATDIAKVLGYKLATDMAKMLDEDETAMHNLHTRFHQSRRGRQRVQH